MSRATATLWATLPASLRASNAHLATSPLARLAAAGAPEHAEEIAQAHADRAAHRAQGKTAQAEGGAFEDWMEAQHAWALAAGWLAWVDHYGPAVRHLPDGTVRVVGKAPPDYLGQLKGGRVVLVEAKRRTKRLELEGEDRAAIRPHQARRLAEAEAGGGLALVVVEFVRAAGVTRHAVPWSEILRAGTRPRGGRLSVGPDDVARWRIVTPCYLAPWMGAASEVSCVR